MNENMSKACIYCRVAAKNSNDALEKQKALLRGVAEEKGLDVVYEIADSAAGLTLESRPGLEELLARAQAGEFGAVLVKDLGRISRYPLEATKIVRDLMAKGVRVVTPDDQHTTRELMSSVIAELVGEFGDMTDYEDDEDDVEEPDEMC